MSYFERIRDVISGPFSGDLIPQRIRLVAVGIDRVAA